MIKKLNRVSPWLYALMLTNFIIYSFCLVLASWAGHFEITSISALWRYFVSFFLLGVYAIVWQQILKRVPLTVAYAARAVTVLLGMLWGAFFFAETINLQMTIGAALIISGVVLVAIR